MNISVKCEKYDRWSYNFKKSEFCCKILFFRKFEDFVKK